ncbi:UvrD-helicase domain-containing protein [Paenibacillus athensensis]|nr:UvrD-helicase domain-containing protein [Paenibacillus athensensis]
MDGAGAEVEGVRTGTDGAEAEVVTRGTDEADVTAEGVRAGTDGDTAALWPEKWPEVCHQTLERLADGQLAYEDAAPYLLLRELVLGFTTSPAVRHVFIDEAQDYSAFQLELLKRLFPRCRMTALGDTNQAIYAHATALETNSAEGYAALYGPEQTEVIRLQRSYRSTREIVLFTRGMIPEGHAIEPFTRAGAKPRVTRAADRESLHRRLAERAAELMAGGCATVAILCKTAGESDYAAAELRSRLPGLRLTTRHSPSMEPGVLVLPSYLAKGVEFDAVLVYDGSERRYARERDRKLLYTVCTRAMHELHVFTLGEPSPFIGEQPEETYELER